LRQILKDNVSILIFPEGTQNRSIEPLQPFYSGAFRMAVETGAPIMPMVVVNAGRLMPPGGLSIKPGKIKVVFGEPIDCSAYTMDRVNELKDHVFQVMSKLLADNEFAQK
jgi:1-acyl-sn-glycerol-3-phosphate acyltransferase